MSPTTPALTEITVRPENAQADAAAIAALLDEAFGGQYESGLVDRLRRTPDYIPELTLVAEHLGKILGYIMLSYVYLEDKEQSRKVVSLGPVAVATEHQKEGIGRILITTAIDLADDRKEPLVILLGHTDYYPRFGFKRASDYEIKPPIPSWDMNYMVLPLTEFSPELKGTVRYTPEWLIDSSPE